MIEAVQMAEQIESACREIQRLSAQLETLGREAASAEAEYDKSLAVVLVKLRDGQEMDAFGITVKNPPATTSEKIAKGLCFKARFKAAMADHNLKACQMKLRAAMAILSGRQSKNRYLDVE